jgi:hypothetical protein
VATICVSFALWSADASDHHEPRKMSTGRRRTIGIDQTQTQPDKPAVREARAVLDRFMAALNAGDEPALLATLHFPHYRLAGGRMRVWDHPERCDDRLLHTAAANQSDGQFYGSSDGARSIDSSKARRQRHCQAGRMRNQASCTEYAICGVGGNLESRRLVSADFPVRFEAPAVFSETRKIVAEELAKRSVTPELPVSNAVKPAVEPLLPRMPLPAHLRDRGRR